MNLKAMICVQVLSVCIAMQVKGMDHVAGKQLGLSVGQNAGSGVQVRDDARDVAEGVSDDARVDDEGRDDVRSGDGVGEDVRVDEGGLLLEGKRFRGIGVNYFNLFSRTLKDPNDTTFDAGLKQLSDANIPFVRFMACGFWPVDWELYEHDKKAYFERLDRIVDSAERHGVGLIPSLFWHSSTVPDLVGEPIDQLGNPHSQTSAFIRQYTEEVVLRYRDSPAIWAWEFGNEYNLNVDLPNATEHRPKVVPRLKTALHRSARDELSSQAMLVAFDQFARSVRKHDRQRVLITGNSLPRTSAYHNSLNKSWQKDSAEQFKEVLLRDNPDPFDVISIHLYGNSGQAETTSVRELVKIAVEIADEANKVLFVGEFGVGKKENGDEERELFEEMLDALVSEQVPLSAVWVFDYSRQDEEWNATFENDRSYMLELVGEANAGE